MDHRDVEIAAARERIRELEARLLGIECELPSEAVTHEQDYPLFGGGLLETGPSHLNVGTQETNEGRQRFEQSFTSPVDALLFGEPEYDASMTGVATPTPAGRISTLRWPLSPVLEETHSAVKGIHKEEVVQLITIQDNKQLIKEIVQEMSACFRPPSVPVQQVPLHTQSHPSSVHVGLTQTFAGNLEEDPKRFLAAVERYLRRYNINEDYDRIETMRKQLTGAARKWADSSRNVPLTFNLFKERFVQQYDSYDQITPILMKLYGERQRPGEPIQDFINAKMALIARVDRPHPIEAYIDLIISLLEERFSVGVRGCRPRDFEELLRFASQIERSYLGSRGAVATQAPRQQPTPQARNAQGPTPPTPCHHCGGWHYNRDCDRNPYRRNQVEQHRNTNQRQNNPPPPQPQRQQPAPQPAPRRSQDSRRQEPPENWRRAEGTSRDGPTARH